MSDATPGPWRTGRKVGRTIYRQIGAEPSDTDPLIGVMDSPDDAALIVGIVNVSHGFAAATKRAVAVMDELLFSESIVLPRPPVPTDPGGVVHSCGARIRLTEDGWVECDSPDRLRLSPKSARSLAAWLAAYADVAEADGGDS